MALRDNFVSDLATVFMNTGEMATTRQFRIADGLGGYTVFDAPVVWDQEASKDMPMVKIHGVYMGDVRCHIEAKYLPKIPAAGEIIYSPANQLWEIVDVCDEEGCYVLSLSSTRSKPGTFLNN